MWLQGFSKILEYNRTNGNQFNMRAAQNLDHIKDTTQTLITTKDVTSKIDGADVYKSMYV